MRAWRPAPTDAARPPAALPLLTYRVAMTFHMDGEDVQAIAVPAAHTDGDTMVRFPDVDVIMTGDFYRSVGYPNIDRANGGTLRGMLAGLNAVIDLAGPNTKIIPGHGATVDKTAVAAHRDMIIAHPRSGGGADQAGQDARRSDRRKACRGLRHESAAGRHHRRSVYRTVIRRVEIAGSVARRR